MQSKWHVQYPFPVVKFRRGKPLSANYPFTALSRWRNAQPGSLVKRHTLFDVLEPRLLFSAEHPLGLAVGQEDFYKYYRRAEDIELTRDTLYVLDALENKNSNSGIDTAEDISKLAEFNIDSGRQLATDASYEVGFEQAVDSIPGGITTEVINVTLIDENDAPERVPDRQIDVQLFDIRNPIAVGDDAFFDEDGDVLSFSLTLADGQPLPDWIIFNQETEELSLGIVPLDIVNAKVLLTANDG
ncbi:MAG: LEPR-XLL domain-containing protein [Granulosicoccus sp.]